jgi:soluble lytic murein transglycosylase-like protein
MRRIVTVMLVTAGLAASSLGSAHAGAGPAQVIKPPPGYKWVGWIIAQDFKGPLGKANYQMAMCVANRESKFNPKAYNPNSGASGVFQFIPNTWAWASVQAGYAGVSPFKARANIGTAAWVVANYGWSPWGGHCP